MALAQGMLNQYDFLILDKLERIYRATPRLFSGNRMNNMVDQIINSFQQSLTGRGGVLGAVSNAFSGNKVHRRQIKQAFRVYIFRRPPGAWVQSMQQGGFMSRYNIGLGQQLLRNPMYSQFINNAIPNFYCNGNTGLGFRGQFGMQPGFSTMPGYGMGMGMGMGPGMGMGMGPGMVPNYQGGKKKTRKNKLNISRKNFRKHNKKHNKKRNTHKL